MTASRPISARRDSAEVLPVDGGELRRRFGERRRPRRRRRRRRRKPRRPPRRERRRLTARGVGTAALERVDEMAEITAALVKQLREQTGAGMMDCKEALDRDRRRPRGRGRLAAQEGSGGGRQEGGPRGLRGPDRRSSSRPRRGAMVEINRRPISSPATRPSRTWSGRRRAGAGSRAAMSRRCAEDVPGHRPDRRRRDHPGDRVIGENINLRRTALVEVDRA